ncbi:MAG: right-handed parallel beta-helix repeat-containing protein [Vulcanimicrobiaceae bacterium]
MLTGPASPPAGAVTLPAGDNSSLNPVANVTYWFAPGTHTFGTGQYGQIIPADDDVFIGAPGAILDGKNLNDYAFTQHATGVTIEYLTIQNFGTPGGNGGEGVVNHDSGVGWTIAYNTIQDNAGAGAFLGTNGVVRDNCLSDNGEYGFQSYSLNAATDNIVLDHNEIAGNNTWNWEAKQPGCGCSGAGKFWNTIGATVTDNWIHDNHGPGLWADTDNDDFEFAGNYIDDNDGEGLFYEISYNALIENNTFVQNALVEGPTNPGFPTGAIYLSESGGDGRVPARYSTIEITGNTFTNNWSGVVLWESADRFCGSPNNTSSGYCTMVNPAANLSTCVAGTIDSPPYYSDCRWKTQNVSVHNNTFSFDPGSIPGCSPSASCGLQGIFSQYGTSPSWSPYMGTVIEDAITFHQNNVFADNTYLGPWEFMAHDQATLLTPAQWQAAPYNQDAGSTF